MKPTFFPPNHKVIYDGFRAQLSPTHAPISADPISSLNCIPSRSPRQTCINVTHFCTASHPRTVIPTGSNFCSLLIRTFVRFVPCSFPIHMHSRLTLRILNRAPLRRRAVAERKRKHVRSPDSFSWKYIAGRKEGGREGRPFSGLLIASPTTTDALAICNYVFGNGRVDRE